MDTKDLKKLNKLRKQFAASKWETEEERLLRFMEIPPKKKLEWLFQMNKFLHRFSSKKQEIIRQKLREEIKGTVLFLNKGDGSIF